MDARGNAPQPAAETRAPEPAPTVLVGCLQKGEGESFILTEMTSPPTPAGARDNPDPRIVREERRAAEHAYWLTGRPEGVPLEGFVGKQVSVTGNVLEPSDLTTAQRGAAPATEGTPRPQTNIKADTAARREGDGKINERDLARVNVLSVTTLVDNCGTKAAARN